MAEPANAAVDVSKLFSLEGKTAIVTGGTGGLGTAMTTALASAGADIVSIELPNDPGSERTRNIVEKTCGRKYRNYECDVSKMKNIRETYQKLWSDGVVADIVVRTFRRVPLYTHQARRALAPKVFPRYTDMLTVNIDSSTALGSSEEQKLLTSRMKTLML